METLREQCFFGRKFRVQLGAFECRLFPPHPTPVQNGKAIGSISMFPMMPADGRCGEFEARLPDPAEPPTH